MIEKKYDTILQAFIEKLDLLLEKSSEYQKEYLSLKEACRYMNVSESMLYKLTAGAQIPYFKPNGKLLYFRRDDLNAWMSRGREDAIW